VLSIFLITATHSWSSADTGTSSVLRNRSIPYFPSVASSSNPALGVTYRPTLLGQLVGSGAVIGAGFALDGAFPADDDQGTTADEVGQFLGSPYTLLSGTVLYGVHGLITNDHGERTTARKMTLALGATYATVAILKVSVSSDRPDGSDNDSFPSGHAAGAFSVATVLDRQYGGVTGWIAYGAAAFVAASRVHGTHHRFEDVVAGAVIGHFYGWLFTR
jgi:membrane-associated phospholipid phosphatase